MLNLKMSLLAPLIFLSPLLTMAESKPSCVGDTPDIVFRCELNVKKNYVKLEDTSNDMVWDFSYKLSIYKSRQNCSRYSESVSSIKEIRLTSDSKIATSIYRPGNGSLSYLNDVGITKHDIIFEPFNSHSSKDFDRSKPIDMIQKITLMNFSTPNEYRESSDLHSRLFDTTYVITLNNSEEPIKGTGTCFSFPGGFSEESQNAFIQKVKIKEAVIRKKLGE